MRNMQQQRQYIINLIVSWAFWDIQDQRLNNLQSSMKCNRERGGHLRAWERVVETSLNTGRSPTVEHRTWEWTADGSTGKVIHKSGLPGGNIFTSRTSADVSGLTDWPEALTWTYRDRREGQNKITKEIEKWVYVRGGLRVQVWGGGGRRWTAWQGPDGCCWNRIGSLFSVWGKSRTLEKEEVRWGSLNREMWLKDEGITGVSSGAKKMNCCQGNWRRRHRNGFRSVLS